MSGKPSMIVFGPTGGTGQAVVEQALLAGHKVTAFSRSPFVATVQHPPSSPSAAIPGAPSTVSRPGTAPSPSRGEGKKNSPSPSTGEGQGGGDNLRVVRGDAFDERAVSDAVKGHDVVVVSLGTRPWRHSNVCSEGTRNVLTAMKKHSVKRLVVVSALGVGPTRDTLAWFLKPLYRTMIRRALDDKEVMEVDVKKSDLDWVLVQPPILTGGRLTGKYRVAIDGSIRHGFISRQDVAHFILHECVAGSKYLRTSPALAY